MGRIQRYVFGELLGVFLATLGVLTSLMILVGVGQEALKQGLGAEPILRLVPYLLPNALRFAIPGTILLAFSAVYGRISAANEVVAVKAMGVSPMVMLWPGYVLAFFVSILAVWLNDVAASWGKQGIQQVVLQSLEQIAYGTLQTHHSYSSTNGQFSISVRDVEGKRLIEPTLTLQAGPQGKPATLQAAEAELESQPDRNALRIIMRNAVIEFGDNQRLLHPGTLEHEIALDSAFQRETSNMHPADIALRKIPREITEQQGGIQSLEQAAAAATAFTLFSGDFSGLAKADVQTRVDAIEAGRLRLYRLYAEPWRRWANGFSCFFFVWVGAPLAIRLRNADLWTTFGLCFLPILIVYYPLMAYGVDRAKAGALPPYAVWSGNLLLLVGGLVLLRRVLRY